MKIKKLILTFSIICLCVFTLIFGVYSTNIQNLNVGGSFTYITPYITVKYYGDGETITSSDPIYQETVNYKNYTLKTQSQLTNQYTTADGYYFINYNIFYQLNSGTASTEVYPPVITEGDTVDLDDFCINYGPNTASNGYMKIVLCLNHIQLNVIFDLSETAKDSGLYTRNNLNYADGDYDWGDSFTLNDAGTNPYGDASLVYYKLYKVLDPDDLDSLEDLDISGTANTLTITTSLVSSGFDMSMEETAIILVKLGTCGSDVWE